MKITTNHPVFNLVKSDVLEGLIKELEKSYDSPDSLLFILAKEIPFDRVVIDSLKDVNEAQKSKSQLKRFILSESVVEMSEKIKVDKVIDDNGYWRNGIKQEMTGVMLYQNYVLLFSIRKERIGGIFVDLNNMKNLSAFSIAHRSTSLHTWYAREHKENTPLKGIIQSVLFMIYAEEATYINLNKKFKRRHKDNDNEIQLNETKVTFTVVDKSWAGKITVGGHMRTGYWGNRWVGSGDDKHLELRWTKPAPIPTYTKKPKRETI